jgi:predicted transcriptional regulator
MTGRELIVYILENGLEDEPVFENGKFIGFITAEQAAVKKHVGVATIEAWIDLRIVDGIDVKAGTYIPANQI